MTANAPTAAPDQATADRLAAWYRRCSCGPKAGDGLRRRGVLRSTSAVVATARRIHLCEVHDGRIAAATAYRNSVWAGELRARTPRGPADPAVMERT